MKNQKNEKISKGLHFRMSVKSFKSQSQEKVNQRKKQNTEPTKIIYNNSRNMKFEGEPSVISSERKSNISSADKQQNFLKRNQSYEIKNLLTNDI